LNLVNCLLGLTPFFRNFVFGHLTEPFFERVEFDLELGVGQELFLGSPSLSLIKVHLSVFLLDEPFAGDFFPRFNLELVNGGNDLELNCIFGNLLRDEG